MQLEVAFEAGGRGQLRRIHRLDGAQVRGVGRQIGQDGIATAIAVAVVGIVQPEIRGQHRIAFDQPPDALLHRVVEAGIGRTGSRTGIRSRECIQGRAPTGSGGTGRPDVSARAARVAAMIVSMSAALTP